MKLLAGSTLVLIVLLAAWTSGFSAPVNGPRSLGSKNSLSNGVLEFKETFRGGERACVIARGHREDDLGIQVFDPAGNTVAKVDNSGDLVAAIWYPPRDANYRVKIFSPEGKSKSCYISLK